MSDDRPIRRPDEPVPTADPAGAGEPTVLRSAEGVPVAAATEAPADGADGADGTGPAHRADSPADVQTSSAAASSSSSEAHSSGAELDPRAEGGGWVTAEPPAVADDGGRAVTVAGPDSAGADSINRPDPGADIVPDALPHDASRRGDSADRVSDDAPADRPSVAVPADRHEDAGVDRTGRPESAAIAREADGASSADRPLSPADQPTTEAPRVTQARADAAAASIHERRPEETGLAAAAPPAVAPAPPPVATPTAPVQQTGEQPVSAPPAPVPVYIESPVRPKRKGNRGFGILMSLLAALVYALVWAGAAALVIALNTASDRIPSSLTTFLASPVYWGPVIAFALGMILLSLLINRGGWAWWLIGGFLVAVAVYFGYLGSALLTVARQITPDDVGDFVGRNAVSPLAIASAVVAREVSIWFGLATSARGKKVKARNAEARQAFDKESAERRSEYDRARAGIAPPPPSS